MSLLRVAAIVCLLMLAGVDRLAAESAPAPLLTCQGRLTTNGAPATGSHSFSFTILDGNGATQWSVSGISLTVSDGLYAVVLGDTTVAGMTAIPASILGTSGLSLQIQADGQTLTPNVAIIPALQADMAFAVAASAVGSAQLQAGAVGTSQLQAGAVTAAILAPSLAAEITPKVRIITSWTGSLTIAARDANGSIVALCGSQSNASPAVSVTFPSAASFPAGGVVRLRFHSQSTSQPSVTYTLAGSDTLTLDQAIYQSAAGSAPLSAATNVLPERVAFVSDGVSAWYELP